MSRLTDRNSVKLKSITGIKFNIFDYLLKLSSYFSLAKLDGHLAFSCGQSKQISYTRLEIHIGIIDFKIPKKQTIYLNNLENSRTTACLLNRFSNNVLVTTDHSSSFNQSKMEWNGFQRVISR